jgi:hypothetical protein
VGVLTSTPVCRYNGDFVNNMKNGVGEQTYPDGECYRGDFVDDDRHGRGEVFYPNGDIFRGKVGRSRHPWWC